MTDRKIDGILQDMRRKYHHRRRCGPIRAEDIARWIERLERLSPEVETLRTRNAELEKELARVRGQRDGLADYCDSRVRRMETALTPRQLQSVEWVRDNILQEIAQEQAQEREDEE